jgi:hypothetical protein
MNNINLNSNNDDEYIIENVELKTNSVQINDELERKDLENMLLQEYNSYEKNKPYILEEVSMKVDEIINLKNEALSIYNSDDIPFFTLFNNYNKGNFNKHWLIPVVLDERFIYNNINIKDAENNNTNCELCESNTIGIKSIDFQTFYKNLNNITSNDKIDSYQYNNKLFNVLNEYNNDSSLLSGEGFKMRSNSRNEFLRYNNIDNDKWRLRVSGEFSNISNQLYTYNDNLNIVGFLLLPPDKSNLYDLIDNKLHNLSCYTKHGELTNINITNNNTIITMNNHNLINNQMIYIDKSDCKPLINNKYKITVVNKDSFKIKFKSNNALNGKNGIIYIFSELHYDTVKVTKINNKFNVNVKNKKNPNLFLFNHLKITQDDIQLLLKSIIPSIDNITDIVKDNTYHTISELDKHLNKYDLSYNYLNYDNVVKLLKNINKDSTNKLLFQNIDKLETDLYKSGYVNTQQTNIYDNKYLFSEDITKYYGKYPYKNSESDTDDMRISWLNISCDKGNYYHAYVFNDIIMHNKQSESSIVSKINIIQQQIANETRIYTKEIKKNSYFKNKICEKFNYNNLSEFKKIYDNINDFTDDYKIFQSHNFINVPFNNGDFCYIKQNNKSHISKWMKDSTAIGYLSSKQQGMVFKWLNNQWIIDYSFMTDADICKLQMTDILNIDIDKLKCIYSDKTGSCMTTREKRFKDRINKHELLLQNYNTLLKYVKSKQQPVSTYNLRKYENKIINIQNKYKNDLLLLIDSKKMKSKVKTTILGRLLNHIHTRIANISTKELYIYKIIDNDGRISDDKSQIISKKYNNEFLFCGHWDYKRRIANILSPNDKNTLEDNMVSLFSNRTTGRTGDEDTDQYHCKYCGELLALAKMNPVVTFDEFNNPTSSYEVVEESDRIKINAILKCELDSYEQDNNSSNVHTKLSEYDITYATIHEMYTTLCRLIGIVIQNDDSVDIINKIVSYCNNTILNSTLPSLLKISKNKLKLKFELLDRTKIYIAANILIYVQLNPPCVTTHSIIFTECNTLDEINIDTMICIINKSSFLNINIMTTGSIDILKNSYNIIKNSVAVRDKFINIKQDKNVINESLMYHSSLINNIPIKSDDYTLNLYKQPDKISKRLEQYYLRNKYIGNRIIEIINTIASSSTPLEYSSLPINYCCAKSVINYNPISFKSLDEEQHNRRLLGYSDNKLHEDTTELVIEYNNLIDESIELNKIRKIIINNIQSTSISPTYKRQNIVKTINNRQLSDVVYNYNKKFIQFCFEGNTKGSRHEFISRDNIKTCIKCNLNYDDIESRTFTLVEYNNLNNIIHRLSIVNLNIKTYQSPLLQLKNTAIKDIKNEIKNLVTKLKSKTINVEFITNIGKIQSNENNISNNVLLQMEIYNLKDMINNYFRPIFSIINHKYKITDDIIDKYNSIIEYEDREQMQYLIINQYITFDKYFEYSKLFSDIVFEHSIDDIVNLSGTLSDNIIILRYILIKQLNDLYTLNKGKSSNYSSVLSEIIINVFNIIKTHYTKKIINYKQLNNLELKIKHDNTEYITAIKGSDGISTAQKNILYLTNGWASMEMDKKDVEDSIERQRVIDAQVTEDDFKITQEIAKMQIETGDRQLDNQIDIDTDEVCEITEAIEDDVGYGDITDE